MTYKTKEKITHRVLVALAWIIALIFFFPIFWMVLTSFKTELQAIAVPPMFIFEGTFDNYILVNERSDIGIMHLIQSSHHLVQLYYH